MAEIDRLTVRLQADVKDLRRGMRSAETTVKRSSTRMQRSFAGVNRSLTRLTSGAGKLKAALVGIGAALAVRAVGRQFLDFDVSLNRIVALVGIAEEGVAKFREELLRLAPAVGKGPGELADALFFVTSAGLRGAQAIDVLTKSAQASAVGLGETKVVAGALTSVIAAYGAENVDAAKAANVFLKAVREGKFEAAELAISLGKVLAPAQQAGVELEEVVAVIAALTRVGIPVTEAVTGLQAILASLNRESEQGAKVLDALGTSFAQVRKEVDENLFDALVNLGVVLNNDATALTDVLSEIKAVNTVLTLTGPLADQVAAIFESTKDATGALAEAFGFISDQARFKLDVALADLGVRMVKIGSVIIPDLVRSIDILNSIFDKLSVVVRGAFESLGHFGDATSAPLDELRRRLAAVNEEIERLSGEPEALLAIRKAFRELSGIPVITVESLAAQRDKITAAIERFVRAEAAAARTAVTGRITPTAGIEDDLRTLETEKVKEAGKAVEDLVRALEDEARILSKTGLEREQLAVRIQAENILRKENLTLTDEQTAALNAAVKAGFDQERANELAADALSSLNDSLEEQVNLTEEASEQTQRLNRAAEDLGFTFASAFEDAIIAGQGLRDILKGLADDILRIILRTTVTSPLAGIITGIIGGAFAGAAGAGSGFTITGTTPGGLPVGVPTGHGGGVIGSGGFPRRAVHPRAFLGAPRMHEGGQLGLQPGDIPFIGRRGETVRTPAQEAALGGFNQTVNLNITTGVQATVRAEILGLLPQITEPIKIATMEELRKRGAGFR